MSAAVTPIVGARDALTPADLAGIANCLAPYHAWFEAKPVTKVDALDAAWIERLAPDKK